jgi:hypothetical protein
MHNHFFLVWMAIVFLTSVFHTGIAQAEAALVCTDPVTLEIGEGQSETLQIVLMNAKNIYGIDLQATFDPTVVQVVDADSKQKGIQMKSGGFLKPDYLVHNTADNKTGTLRYVVTQVNPTPPANGKGVLLSIQFQGKERGASSKLNISSVVISNRRGIKQPVSTRGADLVIVPQKPPTPTPLPTHTRISAPPTLPAVAFIQTTSQPPARTKPTLARDNQVGDVERRLPLSDQILTYISVGGFFGAILFSGLSVWMLTAKRRKERNLKKK